MPKGPCLSRQEARPRAHLGDQGDHPQLRAAQVSEQKGHPPLRQVSAQVSSRGSNGGVKGEGVQKELLVLIEGTSMATDYGLVHRDHMLFAAGAFRQANPPNEPFCTCTCAWTTRSATASATAQTWSATQKLDAAQCFLSVPELQSTMWARMQSAWFCEGGGATQGRGRVARDGGPGRLRR